MSKYSRYSSRQTEERPWTIHPIWRGIGCALLILVPILSYAGAVSFVRANMTNRWISVPAELSGSINFAPVYQALPVTRSFFIGLGRIYYMDLGVSILFMVVAFGLLTILYSALYRVTGTPRYGPYDSPPVKKSPKKGLGKAR